MDFFDRNKLKPMPQYDLSTGKELGARGNNAPCAVGYAWAPDSRYFMVSTTSPRMNVDNGVRLYKYNGLEIQGDQISWDNMKYRPDKLLAAEFVPSPLGFYPDRPQSPPPERSGDTNENETDPIVSGPSKVSANVDDTAAYVPPLGRYVPPAARKLGGAATSGGSLAERMRKEREANTVVATKVVPKISSAGPGARVPIGMMPVEKPKRSSTVKKEPQRESKPIDAVKVEEKLDSATKEDTEASTSIDPEKRSKKLKKLLKQIEELKEKDPSTLNDDQQQKIASEADVIKELAQLGL
jgi:translation initiation factor 2A